MKKWKIYICFRYIKISHREVCSMMKWKRTNEMKKESHKTKSFLPSHSTLSSIFHSFLSTFFSISLLLLHSLLVLFLFALWTEKKRKLNRTNAYLTFSSHKIVYDFNLRLIPVKKREKEIQGMWNNEVEW